jgi:hypothetical protein
MAVKVNTDAHSVVPEYIGHAEATQAMHTAPNHPPARVYGIQEQS